MLVKRLMLVEGADDEHVLKGILAKNRFLPEFDIFDEKSDGELLKDLSFRLKAGGIDQIGILLDSDQAVSTRWTRVKSILKAQNFSDLPNDPDPDGTIIESPGEFLPRIGVWLMPDNVHNGMLEDFVLSLIPAENNLWRRAQVIVDSIPSDERLFKPQHQIKAYVHTWLAWQKEPGIPMGRAIGRGFF